MFLKQIASLTMSSPRSARSSSTSRLAEREAQVEPNGVLDDNRRKAVAAVGDFSHPTSSARRLQGRRNPPGCRRETIGPTPARPQP